MKEMVITPLEMPAVVKVSWNCPITKTQVVLQECLLNELLAGHSSAGTLKARCSLPGSTAALTTLVNIDW